MDSTTLHRQWISRPDDERYLTLQSLYDACNTRKHRSSAELVSSKELEAKYTEGEGDGGLVLTTPNHDQVELNHWSFGQLCNAASSPASYMRKIHPALAADCINWGIQKISSREDNLLYMENKEIEVEVNAFTSPSYGRIYDADCVKAVMDVAGDDWKVPASSYMATDPLRSTTLYASKGDVFLCLVNESNPLEIGERKLHRGILVWNSEVGKMTFGFASFLYDFICDNRTIWGLSNVRELRIRHTINGPDRFGIEAAPILTQYIESSAIREEEVLKRSQRLLVAENENGVKDFLKNRQFNGKQIDKILNAATIEEGGARTYWQVVNGITAYAREIPHTDARIEVERVAGKILESIAA